MTFAKAMSAFDEPKLAASYPISFIMRRTHPELWLRIHSLPESKRYPQNKSDWDTLIDRHRALSDAVLRDGSLCRVHYSLFIDDGVPPDLLPLLAWNAALPITVDDDEQVFTYTAETKWNFDIFLPWIRLRADDQLGWISFHSLVTDSIYSPYDGGADIFSANTVFISEIKNQFGRWKSKRPDGL